MNILSESSKYKVYNYGNIATIVIAKTRRNAIKKGFFIKRDLLRSNLL